MKRSAIGIALAALLAMGDGPKRSPQARDRKASGKDRTKVKAARKQRRKTKR